MSIKAVQNKVNELTLQMAEQGRDISYIKEKVDKIDKTVEGNGNEGLKVAVAKIKQSVKQNTITISIIIGIVINALGYLLR